MCRTGYQLHLPHISYLELCKILNTGAGGGEYGCAHMCTQGGFTETDIVISVSEEGALGMRGRVFAAGEKTHFPGPMLTVCSSQNV